MTLSVEAAINHDQSASPCPLKNANPTAMGIFTGLFMKINGGIRSFQEVMNVTTANAVRAG